MFKKTQQQDSRLLQLNPLSLAVGIALSLPGSFHYAQAETQATNVQEAARQNTAFSISSQPLSSALLRFAEQAGLQVFFADVKLENMQAAALQGRFTPEQGLRQLIGTNPVDFQIGNNGVITLRPRSANVDTVKIDDVMTVRAFTVANPGDWIYEQPRAISIISREQMDNRPARHAADMLEQSAGVYSSVSQQDPALSVNIRGIQDYGRVNMNIDGMRQNFQKSGHGQRNGQMYIDSELLSGATIVKGATSGMGGAGAFGGIATFNTVSASDFLAPGKELGGKLHASTGDNGTHFIGSGVLALGNESGDILVGASERHLGDYWPGNKGKIGDIRTASGSDENTLRASESLKHGKVTDSGHTMRSRLAKVGWNLPANQRIQLSYLQTQTDSPNPSMLTNTTFPELGWKKSGFSNIMSRSSALDYHLNPDDLDWIDFSAKLYYVDTTDESDTYSTSSSINNSYWTRSRMRTYGIQAQNTSRFSLPAQHTLSANYGIDVFYDKANSESTRESMAGVTPDGNRSLASLFANLTYGYDDFLTLEGGLRYDRYRLRGTTGMEITEFPYTVDAPCTANRLTLCSTVKNTHLWKVDSETGKFSPTAAIAIKPGINWLELFSNYGKSWRPPAITETLTTGSAHSSSTQYPNPYLEPERSTAWETGFNVTASELFTESDRLVGKVSYFDTKISNYINMEIGRIKPGVYTGAGSGNAAYVNNLVKTRFRGIEYQLNYDTGRFYADLTYTRMIGQNDFCSNPAWLGGVVIREGGRNNYYATPYDQVNNYVQCNYGTVFSSSSYMPSDRGSLTIGTRAFDRKLDAGAVIRYNRGYQDRSAVNQAGGTGNFYVADWPKYTLFDLYASYQVTNNLKVSGAIENVTNRAYIVSYGDSISYTLGRGRTIQGGIEYRF
ncbi:TonB-dependent receptor [Pectobacterium zantedeschiae]|uniref:TonB-dependent receptor n=1 Tax=Pectobacterium zantedeschiae TaxID=2034769 RepID=A0A9X8JJT1_9GAMM|nr:TonB-dependent receptor [Pectobacterium zantedeschiae]RYC38378.1 TonB-dependent receptor [Pectobacterium zantedeschiae]RYC45023.1 TonB-dependent receptor [Pectobacterium zantedeschiae]